MEDAAHPVEGAVGQQVRTGAQQRGEDGVVGQPCPQALGFTFGLVLHQNKLIPSPGQHGAGGVGASELLCLCVCSRQLRQESRRAGAYESERKTRREKLLCEAQKRDWGLRASASLFPCLLLLPLLLLPLLFFLCWLHHAALISAGALAQCSSTLNPLPASLFFFQMAPYQSIIYLSSFALTYHCIDVSCKPEEEGTLPRHSLSGGLCDYL